MISARQFLLLILALPTIACTLACPGKTPDSKPIEISLYVIPAKQFSAHDGALFDRNSIHNLQASQQLFSTKLDLAKGIPVSAFAPQAKRNGGVVGMLQAKGVTHVTGTSFLGYLPDQFYHRVGWINWYLVKRDASGKVPKVITDKPRFLIGQPDLVKLTESGDQLIGGWGF